MYMQAATNRGNGPTHFLVSCTQTGKEELQLGMQMPFYNALKYMRYISLVPRPHPAPGELQQVEIMDPTHFNVISYSKLDTDVIFMTHYV